MGFRDGPAAGLQALEQVTDDSRVAGGQPIAAVRADLYRRAGRFTEAAQNYRIALAAAGNDAAHGYLRRRLAEVEGSCRAEGADPSAPVA